MLVVEEGAWGVEPRACHCWLGRRGQGAAAIAGRGGGAKQHTKTAYHVERAEHERQQRAEERPRAQALRRQVERGGVLADERRFSLLLLGRLHAHGREQWHSPNMRLLGVVLRRRRQAQKRQSSRPPPQAERIEASRLGRLRCNGAARGAVRARLSARLQHLSGCAIVFASTRASCSGLAVLLRIDLMFFHTNRARY